MPIKFIEKKADLIATLSIKGRFMFYGDEHPLIYVSLHTIIIVDGGP